MPTPDPNDPTLSIQVGEQRVRGFEAELSAELAVWQIRAAYAYNDSEIVRDNTFEEGNRLNLVPRHGGSLWVKHNFGGNLQGFSLAGGVRYVGKREADLANSFRFPGYTVLDLAAFYRHGPWKAQLNVLNALDKDYFTASFGRNSVFVGEPRTIRATLSYEF